MNSFEVSTNPMPRQVPFGKAMHKEFLFDGGYLNLNHGTLHFPRALVTNTEPHILTTAKDHSAPILKLSVMSFVHTKTLSKPDQMNSSATTIRNYWMNPELPLPSTSMPQLKQSHTSQMPRRASTPSCATWHSNPETKSSTSPPSTAHVRKRWHTSPKPRQRTR
jgi:hypothetical protein